MRIAHVLRRYQPNEWGEDETSLLELLDGLHEHGVESSVFHPGKWKSGTLDPLARAGHYVHSFRTCVPIWRVEQSRKQQLMEAGENLMSFNLVHALRYAPALDAIHAHGTGLLGALCRRAARIRNIPCIVTVPDDAAELLEPVLPMFRRWQHRICEWGKLFEVALRSHRLLRDADALLTSSPLRAEFLAEKYPEKRILVQTDGISPARYDTDFRAKALNAFPEIAERTVILCLSGIEPGHNQQWLLYQLPIILNEYPDALLVFAGPCKKVIYKAMLRQCIDAMELSNSVLLTGSMFCGDPRLIGLMQHAKALVLPSIIETSGITIAQAWAAHLPVIANCTAGTVNLIHHEHDGWLFDMTIPHTFQEGLFRILSCHEHAQHLATVGRQRVEREFDACQSVRKIKALYEELIDAKFGVQDQKRSDKLQYYHTAKV